MAEPTPLIVDASNVIVHTQNFVSTRQTRHIGRRELIVREREVCGQLCATKIHTSENLADLLTKVLDRTPFEKLRMGLMNLVIRSLAFSLPMKTRGV